MYKSIYLSIIYFSEIQSNVKNRKIINQLDYIYKTKYSSTITYYIIKQLQ